MAPGDFGHVPALPDGLPVTQFVFSATSAVGVLEWIRGTLTERVQPIERSQCFKSARNGMTAVSS
jgi:hypothetical protein